MPNLNPSHAEPRMHLQTMSTCIRQLLGGVYQGVYDRPSARSSLSGCTSFVREVMSLKTVTRIKQTDPNTETAKSRKPKHIHCFQFTATKSEHLLTCIQCIARPGPVYKTL